MEDLSGKKFNKILIIRYSHSKNNLRIYEAICDCGKSILVIGSSVKRGRIKSCSCILKDMAKRKTEKVTKQILNKKFNKLTVVSFSYIKNQKSYYKCLCECGNTTIIRSNTLQTGLAKSCGCMEHKGLKREKNPQWNHNLTEKERLESNRRNIKPEVKLWRKEILIRDNYACQLSKQKGGKLCVHHLFNWADYPEKRFELGNGITISEPLHKLFHRLYGTKNNTLEQFIEFKFRYDYGEWLDYQI